MKQEQRYLPPSPLARAGTSALAALARGGINVLGARELTVPGRTTGEPRRAVVNVLRHEGADYLVAPRGQVQWVRNLRAAGGGRLRLGRTVREFTATELTDERLTENTLLAENTEKPAVLRAYVRRWKFEIGVFFTDIGPEDSLDRWAGVAARYPVFRLTFES
ncbi:nitroreductase family deazaflavin-dependent oxidoreductase [Sciscionella sediminilitoris]|uniref:nitroreductase family deazaflavin-dependent oxidoreductase n=1 Tax=Sciscionella sediminilitoris TaxID=1445613 RepID=UPI00055FAF89|nr:nitroreductase family deazaflavin-dependent oxidoreductase [Sciscionella sp. SE31]